MKTLAKLKDDGLFVLQARGIAESYYLNRIKFPYLEIEERAFDTWAEQNRKGSQASLKQEPAPTDKASRAASND